LFPRDQFWPKPTINVLPKAYIEPDKFDIAADPVVRFMNREALEKAIDKARKNMEKAAAGLDFIEAARFRDEVEDLQKLLRNK
jgi:excinuclease ABC subunit B